MTSTFNLQRAYGWFTAVLLASLLIALMPLRTAVAQPGPNDDTIDTATPIGIGLGGISAAIDPADDQDYYSFEAVADRTYVAEVFNVAGDLGAPYLFAYDADGDYIDSSDWGCEGGSGNVCNRITFDVSIGGTYSLAVTPSSPTASGTYSICVYDARQRGCGTNALGNASFEADADRNGRPDGWTSDRRFARSSAVRRHGRYVGRLSANNNSNVTIAQAVANHPVGAAYDFSGWVNIPKKRDAFSFTLRVRYRSTSNRTLQVRTIKTYRAATKGWNRASVQLVAPRGTNNVVLELAATSLKRTVYVDDFVFKAAAR